MCGIAGIFDLRAESVVDRRLLTRMTAVLEHRGPDADGFHCAPGVGLGFRRLAIVDLAGGDQPLFNEDRTVCIVFNGEIYNFQPLMKELAGLGHVFRTRCDTEVVVHAWEEWGVACLDRLNGMFAFALWDARRGLLFMARDRLGEKPLYYSQLADGRLLFASELKSLLCCPGVERELDPQAIEDFFAFGYVPDPRSIYRGVAKLAPAHYLLVRRGEPVPDPRPYWDVRFEGGPIASAEEAAEELIGRFSQSVRMRMIADVPLGAFLSGGVDSSAIVAMMAGAGGEPVKTFSIAFGGKGFDESAYADAVAKRYRTEHRVEAVDPDAFDLLDRLATIYDEPFGDSSAMPTLRVCAMARESVTVALSGDGGDEVFGGYRRYRWHCFEEEVRRLLPAAARGPVFGLLGALYPKLDWAPRPLRAKTTLQALALDTADAYFHSVSIVGTALRRQLFDPTLGRDLQGYDARELIRYHIARCGTAEPLSQVQYADFKTYLPGDILTKVDRASMATSLEVRVPLLDHTFVEWTAQLPPRLKLRGGEGKHIFKSALAPYLSRDILYRPKHGFVVPLAAWFRGPLRGRVREALTGAALRRSGLFRIAVIERLLDRHQSGERDHSAVLWTLLMFEAFLRQVHDTPAEAAAGRAGVLDMIV